MNITDEQRFLIRVLAAHAATVCPHRQHSWHRTAENYARAFEDFAKGESSPETVAA